MSDLPAAVAYAYSGDQVEGNHKIEEAHVFHQFTTPSAPPPVSHGVHNPHALNPPTYDEGGIRQFLTYQSFPVGLQEAFIKSLSKIRKRFVIIDDSGSMSTNDGKRKVGNKVISCSRWSELKEECSFFINLAKAGNLLCEFRMLNSAPPIVLSTLHDPEQLGLATLNMCLEDGPSGGTPLCRHIREVISEVQSMEQDLRASGQRVILTICTDGESSDGNLSEFIVECLLLHALRLTKQTNKT